jgi:microcystin degradation protein MlrC
MILSGVMAQRFTTITHTFNVQRLAEDIARRGWMKVDLGRAAGVGPQAVGRFLRGEYQTPRMAAKFARALGFGDVNRYLIKSTVHVRADLKRAAGR